MTYREGQDATGERRFRYNQPFSRIPANKVRERDRELWTRDQMLARVKSMAVAGRKRDLASAEDEIRRLRDDAKYKREFATRAEECA